MNWVGISSTMLYTAFALYSIATIFFGVATTDKRKKGKKNTVGTIAIFTTIVGFASQVIYFITRWIASGHAPLGNMFEFMTFLGMSLVLAFIFIYFIYLLSFLGLFFLSLSFIIIFFV